MGTYLLYNKTYHSLIKHPDLNTNITTFKSSLKQAEPGQDDISFNDNIHCKLGLMLRE